MTKWERFFLWCLTAYMVAVFFGVLIFITYNEYQIIQFRGWL